MSQPPKPQALSREDFPSQAEWIDRLLRPINSFFSQTSAFLGGDLVSQGRVRLAEDTFTTAAVVTDSFPRFFAVPSQPKSVTIGQIEDITNGAVFADAVFPTWTPSNDGRQFQVKVAHLSGLGALTKYRVVYEVLL